jgi:hypothetical protein
MTDPRFRTLYKSLEDAPPPPNEENFYIAVEIERDWIQDYVARDGKWVSYGGPYIPADAG